MRRAQTGTSLIEVLVTVTVLSLGIVAMANLQATGLRLGQSAYQRSQAVALSYQILDAMRANRLAALAGDYDRALDALPPASTDSIANADLQVWLRAISAAMQPYTASAAIVRAGTRFTVTIAWDNPVDQDRASADEDWSETFAVVAEL